MIERKKGKQPLFPQPESVGERDWGTEDLLFLSPGRFMLKKLFMKAGAKGGLQYHQLKDEGGYLVSGEMIIRYDDGQGGLSERLIKAGESFYFPPGVVHQEEAISDCLIIEASSPHFNDRVRCEEDYGLQVSGGLASTTINDIIEK